MEFVSVELRVVVQLQDKNKIRKAFTLLQAGLEPSMVDQIQLAIVSLMTRAIWLPKQVLD